MSNQMTRLPIGTQVYFTGVVDKKFKQNRISVNFITELSQETAAANAIVPLILRKGYKDCPDFSKLNAKLDELYGASLSADVSKYGHYQILSLSIQGIDDQYTIDGQAISADCAKLLCSVLFEPNVVDGKFSPKDTELEKQYLIDTIHAEINDKRSYALSKCKSLMCKGEPLAIRKYGEVDKAEAITPESAVQAYKTLLKTAAVEVMFLGGGNTEQVQKVFEKAFSKNRTPIEIVPTITKNRAYQVDETTERMDVSQSKMVMGFRTGNLENDRQKIAMRLMTALFGGTPFSKLFTNVREKLSLCYYCAANFDRATGILMVDSGIEGENRTKAYDEILRQLKAVQDGDFTDEELNNTVLAVQNSLATVTDSLGGMESWYLMQIMAGTNHSPEEESKTFSAISRQEVIEAANKVTLDTVYFLTGKEAKRG